MNFKQATTHLLILSVIQREALQIHCIQHWGQKYGRLSTYLIGAVAVFTSYTFFLIGMIKVLEYPSSTTYFLNILLPLLETISSSLLHFFFLTFMFNLAHNLQFLGRSLFSNVRKIQPSPVFFSIDSQHAPAHFI